MDRLSDLELLGEYASSGSDEAFGELVRRHLGLVRGVALRQLRDEHLADEVCQAVFLALARKAGTMPTGTVVADWLFRATRFAAGKLARDEERRSRHEREAAMTHFENVTEDTASHEAWEGIAPLMNEALEALSPKDREAVLLRFFERQAFAEVGRDLGTSEDAAKMRVGRALERLRSFFRKRGVVLGTATLAGAMAAHAAVPVPAHLASAVSAGLAGTDASTARIAPQADAILHHWRWLRLKRWLAGLGILLLMVGLLWLMGGVFGWRRNSSAPAWPQPAPQWPGR